MLGEERLRPGVRAWRLGRHPAMRLTEAVMVKRAHIRIDKIGEESGQVFGYLGSYPSLNRVGRSSRIRHADGSPNRRRGALSTLLVHVGGVRVFVDAPGHVLKIRFGLLPYGQVATLHRAHAEITVTGKAPGAS